MGKVKVKLSLCLTNQALRHEGVWWSGCIGPHFLDLGTSWRLVVSFTRRGKSPRYPLDMRLGGPQSRSGGHFRRVKRPGREAVHSPSSAEVKKMWLYTSTPPDVFTA
jgi:hypothetical protein